MSFPIIPSLLGRDWWDTWDYPSSISDQFFGQPLYEEDLLPPAMQRGLLIRPRTQANIAVSGKSQVKSDKNELQLSLNVSQFKPEEVEVKIVGNFIAVHAKHEERSDGAGFVSREFTRRYMLPRSCDSDKVTSSLSPDGVLTINVPKITVEEKPKERQIPIEKEEQKSAEDEEMN